MGIEQSIIDAIMNDEGLESLDELLQMSESIHDNMKDYATKIEITSNNLSKAYTGALKQNRNAYDAARNVDDFDGQSTDEMVNKYNSLQIALELIEKKIIRLRKDQE